MAALNFFENLVVRLQQLVPQFDQLVVFGAQLQLLDDFEVVFIHLHLRVLLLQTD